MAVINHLDKYDLDSHVSTFYKKAAMYLLYGMFAREKPNVTYTEFPAGNNRYRDWWKFTHNRVIGPTASPFQHVNTVDIDQYTFDIDTTDNHLISDFMVLNYTAKLCILNLDNNNEVHVDMLSSLFACIKTNQLKSAYAYLSMLYQLLKITEEKNALDKTHKRQWDGATLTPDDI